MAGISSHIPDAPALFSADAATYEAERRQLVPCFDDLYGTAVDVLSWRPGPVERVLDLGAGTGLLSRRIASAHPGVACTLLDGSAEMLARAVPAFPEGTPVTTVVGDLTGPLPAGPFDAVVSALAVHHLADEAKADLARRVQAVLRPGGVFVNAEQVLGPTAWLEARYDERWEAAARGLGADDDVVGRSRARMAADRCSPVEDQLRWLREAGFVDVDAPYRAGRFAVLVGWRAPAAGPGADGSNLDRW